MKKNFNVVCEVKCVGDKRCQPLIEFLVGLFEASLQDAFSLGLIYFKDLNVHFKLNSKKVGKCE